MFTAVLGMFVFAAAPPAATAAGCSEQCQRYEFLGVKGFGCVTGRQGTNCRSWGDVCMIMTGCRYTLLKRSDGSTLAVRRFCGGEAASS